jgi:hypothetical protein
MPRVVTLTTPIQTESGKGNNTQSPYCESESALTFEVFHSQPRDFELTPVVV